MKFLGTTGEARDDLQFAVAVQVKQIKRFEDLALAVESYLQHPGVPLMLQDHPVNPHRFIRRFIEYHRFFNPVVVQIGRPDGADVADISRRDDFSAFQLRLDDADQRCAIRGELRGLH
ncbi:hypothetical protein D3C74_367370 [compost metagenome]